MVGAAAMIAGAMQAPVAGRALVLELTHSGFGLMTPMIVATVISTAVVRYSTGTQFILPAYQPALRPPQRRRRDGRSG